MQKFDCNIKYNTKDYWSFEEVYIITFNVNQCKIKIHIELLDYWRLHFFQKFYRESWLY